MDIGANVGTYTILAGKVVGAKVMSFEPIPATFDALCKNIKLNNLEKRIIAHQSGIGAVDSMMTMTANHDTMNHITSEETEAPARIVPENYNASTVEVPVKRLDDLLQRKISLLVMGHLLTVGKILLQVKCSTKMKGF